MSKDKIMELNQGDSIANSELDKINSDKVKSDTNIPNDNEIEESGSGDGKDSDLVEMSVEELAESVEKPEAKASEKKTEDKNKKKKKKSGFVKWVKKHKGLLIFLAILIVFLFYRINSKRKELEAMMQEMADSQKFDIITNQDIAETISTTGTIKASKTSTLYSALKDTKITAVNYEVGDHVEEGDVVVTFSDDNINKQIEEVKEDIALNQQKEVISANDRERAYLYNYGTEAYNLSTAAEQVDQKLKALYEACDGYGDLKRKLQDVKDNPDYYIERGEDPEALKRTLESSIATAYEREQQAQIAYNDAVSNLAEVNRRAANGLANAQSTYDTGNLTANDSGKTLQRKLQDLQDSLDDYIVTSPISGTVTQVSVEAGNGFNAGNLMVIQQDDVLLVTTEVDECDIPKVVNGQSVVIKTDATGDDELEGYVSFVSPVSTASQSTTSNASATASSGVTYNVEVTITTKDDRLRIGMSAKLNIIILQHTDTFVVPYNAIETNADGDTYIRVVDNSKPKDANGPEGGNGGSGIEVVGLDGNSKSTNKGSSESEDAAGTDEFGFPSVNYREITVTKGIEADYYTEIISDEIKEGMQVLLTDNTSDDNMFDFFGGGMGRGRDF